MRRSRHVLCVFIFLFTTVIAPVYAQDPDFQEEFTAMKAQLAQMQNKMSELEEKVSRQELQIIQSEAIKDQYEQRIKDMEDELNQKVRSFDSASVQTPAPARWTPEIGAVADIVYTHASTKEDAEGANRLSVRELELVMGSDIDPFSRLDATIAFSDLEDPSLEEAYMTRYGLPFQSTARLGKFKPLVGKALPAHRDSLETVDEPLVIQRYFGVEGLNKTGLDISAPIELPWPVTHQLAVGVLEGGNGEEGTAFGTAGRTPTLYSHLKNYFDLTDTAGMELGVSHMAGSGNDEPGFDAQVIGADFTLTQKLGANQKIKWQNEVFNLNRRKTVDADGNLWGAYGLLDYRFHPQWSAGFRYDYAQLVDNPAENPHNNDSAESGYVTFYQSEFARWRTQYKHSRLATGKDDHTVYLQGTFVIGDHKHKIQ